MTDPIAVASLAFTIITTVCALYLAFAALRHTARPTVGVRLSSPGVLPCDREHWFVFVLENQGHWYGRPTAIDVAVFCNFTHAFQLLECRYGSAQEFSDRTVKVGVGRMHYLKAKGIKLTYGEEGEEVHVLARTPKGPGEYLIRISACSDNGVSLMQEFKVSCQTEKG